ncbi:MAG: gamma-glutamyl-gamma-aminobutyrate hydrolase family protein [Planctomycetes bacterium]|nr:gamma-glutamyl-gamma-aminobutyrate hydrolase family protein [Planctomycetota bacterium]
MTKLVAITSDLVDPHYEVRRLYADCVLRAGATPVLLVPDAATVPDIIDRFDAFVLTGGDDLDMRAFGEQNHAKVQLVAPDRQAFEKALVLALRARPRIPALGVCFGMQMMGVVAGARLLQHLPDVLDSAGDHLGDQEHPVTGDLGEGLVTSQHHQALADGGDWRVIARSPDGTIEAIDNPAAVFQVGVQWHPERTRDAVLGQGLFDRLVATLSATRSRD